MKIQFDPKQQYQLDAVASVVDLFDGQPLERMDYAFLAGGSGPAFARVLRPYGGREMLAPSTGSGQAPIGTD